MCRACKNTLPANGNCKNVSIYKDQIHLLFSYDLEEDIVDTHPLQICDICRRKLDNCKNKLHETNDSIPVYHPHTDLDCEVCNWKPQQQKKRFSIILIKEKPKSILESAVENSFVDLSKFCGKNFIATFGYFEPNKIGYPEMRLSVTINEEYSWDIMVETQVIARNHCPIVTQLPDIIKMDNAEKIFSVLKETKVCPGNDDFAEIVDKKLRIKNDLFFKDKNSTVKAKIETLKGDGIEKLKTIRVSACEFLIHKSSLRCIPCQEYRKTLNTYKQRYLKEQEQSIFKPNKFMTCEELSNKASQQQSEIKPLRKRITALNTYVSTLVASEGVPLTEDINGSY